jgi:hypothetical protein
MIAFFPDQVRKNRGIHLPLVRGAMPGAPLSWLGRKFAAMERARRIMA